MPYKDGNLVKWTFFLLLFQVASFNCMDDTVVPTTGRAYSLKIPLIQEIIQSTNLNR